MKAHLSPRDLALTLLVVVLWGFAFVLIKIALREAGPFTLAAARFTFAALPMVFFVRRPALPWRYVVGYGFAIGVLQFGFAFLGIHLGMPAGLSSIVMQMQVFFTIGLAVLFTGDRLGRHQYLAAGLATAGMVVLAGAKLAQGANATFFGFMLVLLGSLSWAIGNIIAKRGATAYGADMFALVVWSSLVPPLPLAALAYMFEGGSAAWDALIGMSATGWACVLFMSWAATLFGFGTWAALLHRYSVALISPFALLIPISGLVSGALVLGETLSPVQAVGALLVFAGLATNVYGPRLLARLRKD